MISGRLAKCIPDSRLGYGSCLWVSPIQNLAMASVNKGKNKQKRCSDSYDKRLFSYLSDCSPVSVKVTVLSLCHFFFCLIAYFGLQSYP